MLQTRAIYMQVYKYDVVFMAYIFNSQSCAYVCFFGISCLHESHTLNFIGGVAHMYGLIGQRPTR